MTASDLARWDISLMKGEILSPASTKALATQMTLTDGTATNYVLGLAVKTLMVSVHGWLACKVIKMPGILGTLAHEALR